MKFSSLISVAALLVSSAQGKVWTLSEIKKQELVKMHNADIHTINEALIQANLESMLTEKPVMLVESPEA